jgi:hypothetical protein
MMAGAIKRLIHNIRLPLPAKIAGLCLYDGAVLHRLHENESATALEQVNRPESGGGDKRGLEISGVCQSFPAARL